MPAQKTSSSVFISHSSKDNKFVRRLAEAFKKHGIEIWLDEHKLRPGDSLYGVIGPALNKADRPPPRTQPFDMFETAETPETNQTTRTPKHIKRRVTPASQILRL